MIQPASTTDHKPSKKGSLEVICGSMFSGKTEEFMRRLKRAEYAKKRVLTIKHHIDNRKNHSTIESIASHDGQERVAFPVDGTKDEINRIIELAEKNVDVVGIDEIQFFPKEIIQVINHLVEDGKRVIASGLDLDFRGEPFSITPHLLSIADTIQKLQAICVQCGKDAHFTQRVINGKPAHYNDPIILVGSQEYYEARCRDCFRIDRGPHLQVHGAHHVKTKTSIQL